MEKLPSGPVGTPTDRARRLRREASDAENKLWLHLKNRQLGGAKFVRQKTFGDYILDFYCYQAFLVVEVDGSQHFEPEQARKDAARTRYLEGRGLRVVRFNNREVLLETQAVLERILELLSPSPNPLPGGEDLAHRISATSFTQPKEFLFDHIAT